MYIVLYFLASMNMNLILYSQVPSSDRILKVQVNNIVWTPLSPTFLHDDDKMF